MSTILHIFVLVRALVLHRDKLALENLALRQQLAVLKRSVKRPKIDDSDRVFWILLRRLWKQWADSLVFVRPDTVIRWHRKGWKYYWKRKSRSPTPGRPPISFKLIHLIRKMSNENAIWGAPHICSELALLGHAVGETTVAKYMVKHRDPDRGQRWSTFLRNHMNTTVACDFFVVPTMFFKTLYCFVILSHDRRRILHVNVTKNPTAEWTGRQLLEAIPGDGDEPRFLLRDRDGIYGDEFSRQVKLVGLRELKISPRSPWQNPYCERVIGSLRRECTDHIIPLGEKHLLRVLRQFIDDYYHTERPHLSLGRNSPIPRTVQPPSLGEVQCHPVLGGLHHRYFRVA